jgi:WD40 repeat protein
LHTFRDLNQYGSCGVKCVTFSPDGSQLLSFWTGRLTLWEVGTGQLLAEMEVDENFLVDIAFGVDGTSFILRDGGGWVRR